MPAPTMRLTKTSVESLKPKPKDYVAWCDQLKGFGCRVWPSGKKVMIVQFRVSGARRRTQKKTIGEYGKLTVEEARKQAREWLAAAQLGENPIEKQRRANGALSMNELCAEYLVRGVAHKKLSTIATDKGRINAHIRPLLGQRRINEITSSDIEKFVDAVAVGKTAKDERTSKHGRIRVRGGKGTATRTKRLLGGIFTYAIKQGYLTSNPCAGVTPFKDANHERYLSKDEIARLLQTLDLAETEGLPWTRRDDAKFKHRPRNAEANSVVMSPHATGAIRLLLLTGCRLREILHLRWDDVQPDKHWFTLSDSKTGKRAVRLSAQARDVLDDIPATGDYVIRGKYPDKPRSDLQRPWKRICQHAELENVRLHDLRHTFASLGAANGISLPMLGKLLGHKSVATTQRYAHIADEYLDRATNTIGSLIVPVEHDEKNHGGSNN